MQIRDHFVTTGGALKNWFIGQSYDAHAVAAIWLVGLLILRVPLAPIWAMIAGVCQFVPNIGPVLGVAGPAIAGGLSGGWERMLYVLILYAIIVVVDGLFLQPYLMKRTTRVPIWVSIIAPLVLGIVIPFWGVLLAGPLLAVVYSFKAKRKALQLSARVDSGGPHDLL